MEPFFARAAHQDYPSGNDSLADVSISFAVNATLQAMPVSAVIRAGQLVYRVAHGVELSEAAQGAAIGFLQDAALTFVSAGLLRYAVGTLPLRAAGAALVRAADSVWNIAGIAQRGEAVESFVFQNVLGRARQLVWNFPVIDDFFEGTATSIKSLDLTGTTYQTASSVLSRLSSYAADLSEFQGRRWAGQTVAGSLIKERVLIVAIEDGAATVEQEVALKQFLESYKALWPNIKVAIETIP